tara:strand:+ start:2189 stop:2479 length:291 start_codon:yes stop_codon:yes gene_type:complete
MPRTSTTRSIINTHSKICTAFEVKKYEDCKTIEEKINCLEIYLRNINKCLEEAYGLCPSSCAIGAVKNEVSNPIFHKKLYETRLRMLRKQLKRKKK